LREILAAAVRVSTSDLAYYNGICKHQLKRLAIIARQTSVQLSLQNAILIYDFYHQPVMELYYQEKYSPSAYWIFIIFIRTISVCVSAYCIFLPLIEDYRMTCYKTYHAPPSLGQIITKIIQILSKILLSTGLTYLKWISTFESEISMICFVHGFSGSAGSLQAFLQINHIIAYMRACRAYLSLHQFFTLIFYTNFFEKSFSKIQNLV